MTAGKEEQRGGDDFEALKHQVGNLFNAGRPEEAVVLLEKEKNRFPENLYDIIFSLAYGYLITDNRGRALDVLEEGVERDLWFTFPLEAPAIRSLVGDSRFERILAFSDARRREAQAAAGPGVEVVLPNGTAKGRPYPLFIALHGWGDGLEEMMEHWKSPILEGEFLTAFFQSSQVVKMDGGRGWDDAALGREEISRLYHEIAERYPIRTDHILIGGFSQGGRMAIDVMINEVLPIAGFVVLCPGGGIPGGVDLTSAKRAVDRGVRGTILTGDKDPDLSDQKRMAAVFEKAGLDFSLVINEGLGHWFPEDFDLQLDRAISQIPIE